MFKKVILLYWKWQGRRKLLKVWGGGTGFEGHFLKKKGHLKRGGGLKKFFRTYQKNFPDISHFFQKNFQDIPKKFSGYHIFPGNEKNFPENNVNSSFQKCPWAKKGNP
jgi:hypothetical protein